MPSRGALEARGASQCRGAETQPVQANKRYAATGIFVIAISAIMCFTVKEPTAKIKEFSFVV
jgi:hypothetical protein